MIFNKVIKKTIFFLGFGLIYLNSYSAFAANSDYAALPPFISADVKANVLFVMDYSGSMSLKAYPGSYDNGEEYYGYFDSDKFYKYNNTKEYWEISSSGTLSGNYANWYSMSRVDVAFKSLFGGKATCQSNSDYCILEPRLGLKHNGKNYNAKVKIDKEDRKGIIQENFDKVRFGFMAYSWDNVSDTREGTIKYGFHENDMDTLIEKFQNTTVNGNTRTGEALREAYRYLTQSSDSYSYNSSYVDKKTEKDPYYEKRSDGIVEPAFCRKSFVVLISDGEYNGSIDPDGWAQKLNIEDLRPEKEPDPDDPDEKEMEIIKGKQSAKVYSLFAFSNDIRGEQSMKTVAAFGQYKDLDNCGDGPYSFNVANDSRKNEFDKDPLKKCTDPGGTYNDCCKEWDSNKDGIPDGFYKVDDGEAMASALTAIFNEIRQGTSSGTAVTALTSKTTGGAVLAQAAFYPEKEYENKKKIAWTGDLVGNWYLNDEFKDKDGKYQKIQNIREDTNQNSILNVEKDRILEYLIEDDALKIKAYEPNKYGGKDNDATFNEYSSFQDVKNLFDSGKKLMETKPEDRKIYGVDKNNALTEFTQTNSALFDSVLGTDKTEYPLCLIDGSNPDYGKLINYTRGKDFTGCRLRAANNSTTDENVWKLGDITYSSPTIVNYNTHAIIYVSSNSGMLHAFRMGFVRNRLEILNPTELINESAPGFNTDKVGTEEWAFIPKDAMPYLRYMASPDYDHIYTVDLKPFIVNTGSKRILIGGMRLGGGNKNGNVNPPSDTAPTGRSAYYALDITDSANPKYLWRYAPDNLGFSYSGPAYIKRMDSSGNIKHFVMFASGPTEYNGTTNQDLQVFVIDLLTGEEKAVKTNLKNNAFGGRLFTNGLDVNNDGQTDFVFLGYTDKADKDFKEMGGGVIKIYTGSDDPANWDYNTSFLTSDNNPVTAPVTFEKCFPESIPYPYLYFGTGRYFVSNDDTQEDSADDDTQEDSADQNYLYGVPFTCKADNTGCSPISSIGNEGGLDKDNDGCKKLKEVTTKPEEAAWKIKLKANESSFLRERCYSDPSPSTENIVFFATAMPTMATCQCGGKSRSWSLNCATGRGLLYDICENESVYEVDPGIQFEYLLQLSGGDIKQYRKDSYDQKGDGSSEFSSGVVSESGGMPVFSNKTNPGLTPTIHYWKEW